MDAYMDKDGYYGDFTTKAVSDFQSKVGLPVTGLPEYETLERVFEGDTNVRLAP
jgi:peptidoglycan hydrolase-like protein with peptidoglycan-binding domain